VTLSIQIAAQLGGEEHSVLELSDSTIRENIIRTVQEGRVAQYMALCYNDKLSAGIVTNMFQLEID
jgi:hypothetical protein